MNEPTATKPANAAAECCAEVNQYVRSNPGTTLLVAVGAGLVIGLIVRGMRHTPPRRRLMKLIEDLQDRVLEAAAPVARKAAAMAGESAEVLRERAQGGEAWVERCIKDTKNRLRKIFS